MATDSESIVRPRLREPKQSRSSSSLQRLIDTTVEMLRESDHADFTIQELSKRAGVSIGSIYHRFRNKQELMQEVQVRFLDRIEQEHAVVINRLRRRRLPLGELVPAAVRDYCEHLRENARMLQVFMQLAASDPLIASNGRKYYVQSVQDFQSLLLDQGEAISHRDPAHAVRFGYEVMYAVVGRHFGPGMVSDRLDEDAWCTIVDDLGQMLLAFLSA